VGFDRRAYDEGARIIQAVAEELGGRKQAVAFLRHLHRTRRFDPFTTVTLVDEIRAFSGKDFHQRFRHWLYSDTESAAAVESPHSWLHQVDMTPPGANRPLGEP
jgi:aminopeptidase N